MMKRLKCIVINKGRLINLKKNHNMENQKSSREEVEDMLKMYKAGVSYAEIGRKYKKDHTVPMYWVGKCLSKKDMKLHEENLPKIIRKQRGGPRFMGKYKDKNSLKYCQECGKPRKEFNLGWKLTHFCSLKCWEKKFGYERF